MEIIYGHKPRFYIFYQKVILNNEQSNVRSAVPQETVLGVTLLFLLFINDFPHGITSSARLFTDDSILYQKVESSTDSGLLQEDLNMVIAAKSLTNTEYSDMELHNKLS